MNFPITALLDAERSTQWLLRYFHPDGLHCVHCQTSVAQARPFRRTKRSQLVVYRCGVCQGIYTLYSQTVFHGSHLRPAKVVLLLRGILQGESSLGLARELKISRQTAHHYRHAVLVNLLRQQPTTPLPDAAVETDELFQRAGEKRGKTPESGGSTPPPRITVARTWHLCQ